MSKVRIGFIGCGGIAGWHAQRLAPVSDAQIVALCDTSAPALKGFKERNPKLAKAPTFADWREMLDKVKLDAIEVHTPHTLHYEQIMAGLDRGLHVLTEKPMVCSTTHAFAIAKKVQETGLKLQVSYQWIFDNRFRHAQKLVASGELGEVLFVNAVLSQEWKLSQKGTWRQDPALSGGGQLNDSGSHLVNIILWIGGLVPSEVAAFVDNRGTPVDINSAVSVRFENGAQATIGVLGDCSRWWDEWVMWGEKGMLVYDEGILTHTAADGKQERLEHQPDESDPDRNFVEAILGKAQLAVPVERGVRAIQLTEAAWESARTGRVAKVAND